MLRKKEREWMRLRRRRRRREREEKEVPIQPKNEISAAPKKEVNRKASATAVKTTAEPLPIG